MFKEEEDQLTTIKDTYQAVPIPNQIDHYIQAGLNQAGNIHKRKRRVRLSSLAVAMILFLFLISIRVSPVFAAYVGQIPGLDRLVELIQGDKGLEAALDHDFIQVIGLSDTKQGITLTVDQIIADESKMILFYSLESDQDYNDIMLKDPEFTNEDGEDIAVAFRLDSHDGIQAGEMITGKIDIDFSPGAALPEQINISTQIDVNTSGPNIHADEPLNITFSVDHEKFAGNKETYKINETVSIEGQKITFKEITVYPTKITIHVKYDEQNTKELFDFDDLMIVNEKGEEWASIMNGAIGQVINENEEVLFFQSNFFDQPQELFLKFSSIRALDKDKLDVVIDLEQEKLLQRPNDQLELLKVSKEGNATYLEFMIQRSAEIYTDTLYLDFSHTYYDEGGNEYETHGDFGSLTGRDDSEYIVFISVIKPEDGGPITLKVNDYPTRISEQIKIKVK